MTVHDAKGNDRTAEWSPDKLYKIAAVAVTAGTPVVIGTPGGGLTIRVQSYHLSLSVAGSVILKDGGAADAELFRTPLMAAGIGQQSPEMGYGVKLAAPNGTLKIDASATGNVSGWVMGIEE
jgi:hypothetical protein